MRLINADERKKRLLDYFDYSMELCAEVSDFIDDAPTIETCTDTISRQAAIDAVKRVLGDYEISRTMQMALHILPSAQAEIIYCKDCIHHLGELTDCPMCPMSGWGRQDDDFCSRAERKCK